MKQTGEGVMEKLALELEIRVKYPESFWNISSYSFKKDIWQNHIVKNGLRSMEDLEKVISTLFSPETEFIYPLDWAWSEQTVQSRRKERRQTERNSEEGWQFRETDWGLLSELYEEIFCTLLEKGSFSILELNRKDENEKGLWLQQKENIDLFMMFVISGVTLDLKYTGEDERLKLFSMLCDRNPSLKALQGRRIASKIEDTEGSFNWSELFISPYTIISRMRS